MTEPERESMEVDVLYVGAGPATLSSAYHLMKQVEAHNAACEKTGEEPIEPPTILVIEKAAGIGDHQLSGGVMNNQSISAWNSRHASHSSDPAMTVTHASKASCEIARSADSVMVTGPSRLATYGQRLCDRAGSATPSGTIFGSANSIVPKRTMPHTFPNLTRS